MSSSLYVCAILLLPELVLTYSREHDAHLVAIDGSGLPRLMRSQAQGPGLLQTANPYTKQKGVDGPPGSPNNMDVVSMATATAAEKPAANVEAAQMVFVGRIVAAAVMAVLGLLAALVYRYVKKWPAVSEESIDMKQWSSGHFACFSDLPVCCIACFCPCIRWGDTMDMASVIAFWPAVLAFLFLSVSDLLLPIPICLLILVVLMTYGRQRLRKGFEMGHGDFQSICGDCLFVTFCTPCAIAQEARHAEKAAEVNHPLVAEKRPIEGAAAQGAAAAPAQGGMSQPQASAASPAAAAEQQKGPDSKATKDAANDSDEEF